MPGTAARTDTAGENAWAIRKAAAAEAQQRNARRRKIIVGLGRHAMFCGVIPIARWLLISLCACAWVRASDSSTTVWTNVALRPLGGGVFQLGALRLNKSKRAIQFDAVANIVSELAVEYAVVHKIGKTHETMFRTDTRAQEVHVAMLLLGAKPAMTNLFPEDLSVRPPGEPVTVEVSWKESGAAVRHPMEDLILNRETGKSLRRGVWIYNGSNFSEGMFTAQRDGSLISIHIDPDALINNPRPGRDNDDLHVPNTKLLPPTGTKVEITIRFAGSANEKSP